MAGFGAVVRQYASFNIVYVELEMRIDAAKVVFGVFHSSYGEQYQRDPKTETRHMTYTSLKSVHGCGQRFPMLFPCFF